MSERNWLRELNVITADNILGLSTKSLGTWPGITDVIICLNRWLILVLSKKIDLPGYQCWKILDLGTDQLLGSIHLEDVYSPRTWVEIKPEGFILFWWDESSGSGYTEYNLNTGEEHAYASCLNTTVPTSLTTRNKISFTGVGKYISLSENIANCQSLCSLPVSQNRTIANVALDNRFIVTVELDTQEVKVWYLAWTRAA